MQTKLKTFRVRYQTKGTYDAEIKAENLTDALTLALTMDEKELHGRPGDVLDESVEITGVFN